MRSLLAAILTLFLPGRGTHRSAAPPPPLPRISCPPAPEPSPGIPCPRPADVILADGLPLVRPYVGAAVLATPGGRDRVPWEVAV